MIDQALLFLRDEINAYVHLRTNATTVEVKLSKIVNDLGKYAFPDDSIALTIFNLEEDHIFKAQLPEFTYVDGQHQRREPELKFILHAMFAANFGIYEEAWKAIGLVLGFFQSHPVFLAEEYPALSPKIGKLTVELESLSVEQLNQIWAYLGAKHLPSVAYKIRMVIIQDEFATAIQKPVISFKTNIHRR
ncbi:MAG: DUF4255 domain-containing protein [Bacteroidia bacterium]|nr:DUF4255 domain-containing protein [Bacteroidia bacterium]